MKHTPIDAQGSLLFLAKGAGGFDVSGCPDAREMATSIATACNAHDDLVAALNKINDTIYGTGAPVGSEAYFEIRHAVVDVMRKHKLPMTGYGAKS